MKKVTLATICLVLAIGLTGCGSKHEESRAKNAYNPKALTSAPIEKTAVLKAANTLFLYEADGKALVGKFRMNMFGGGGPDSVRVDEGTHSISFKKKKFENNFYIRNISLQGNHEYMINYLVSNGKFYYWVEDLTDSKVVYGKKVTKEDLAKRS